MGLITIQKAFSVVSHLNFIFLTAEDNCGKNTLHHLATVCFYTAKVQQHAYFHSEEFVGWFVVFLPGYHEDISKVKTQCIFSSNRKLNPNM